MHPLYRALGDAEQLIGGPSGIVYLYPSVWAKRLSGVLSLMWLPTTGWTSWVMTSKYLVSGRWISFSTLPHC